MKIEKAILRFFMAVVVLVAVVLLGSFVNHKIQLNKEESLYKPLGQIVEVDGKKMSVYVEGSGDKTLVFMAGGGTCSPILDFKSLYSRLSSEYKIVVIERFGYGFSDIVDNKRDIDTMLDESRQALQKLNIEAPYILCPHSMSGIQALYWAQKYPREVKAIVGLDMSVPDSYQDYSVNMFMIKFSSFAAKIGITRFMPAIAESEAIKYGTLTDKEKQIYRAVFYRRTADVTMIDEVKAIKDSALKVKKGKALDIPVLMFCSNGVDTGWNADKWIEYEHDYAKSNKKTRMIDLNCSHYVQDHEYIKISDDMKKFIEEIK